MNQNTDYQISQSQTVINLPYENATELDMVKVGMYSILYFMD